MMHALVAFVIGSIGQPAAEFEAQRWETAVAVCHGRERQPREVAV
jgi:hypothetical protein